MIAGVLVTLVVYVQNVVSGYIEKVEVSGCESCRLMLTCRQLDTIIAILDVDFRMKNPIFDTGVIQNRGVQVFPPDHPRDALNKRCSGVNHCSFILREDSPGSEAWGFGNITIRYACITQDRIHRYCNSQVRLDENISAGLLHNPGYPRFYAGQRKCTWKITAPSQKRISLRILDLALFDTRVSSITDCKDVLQIKDTNQVIFSTCKQGYPPDEIRSGSESVEVVLRSRHEINARRGVLIYFQTVGCQVPEPPKQGYLVSKNDSYASFTCCRGYLFPDTRTKSRTIECQGVNWNISLPLLDCEEAHKLESVRSRKVKLEPPDMSSDLALPITIIILLFVVNAVVLYYIQKARKKNALEIRDEELGTFTAGRAGHK
ncbi:uncharacterized protein LOC115879666 isoform X2 [Sitophilus oryzae]|uniref:Uncharacterized protein LOC115879666 isoform X2 n=1 Tax=Sitophilus oryzae TaxID=7048 RepID=A0A6J2XNK2_SITOR|nr:uncharacterized protein LOC115879666 isoform X2 [Sitophilus oryzae]